MAQHQSTDIYLAHEFEMKPSTSRVYARSIPTAIRHAMLQQLPLLRVMQTGFVQADFEPTLWGSWQKVGLIIKTHARSDLVSDQDGQDS